MIRILAIFFGVFGAIFTACSSIGTGLFLPTANPYAGQTFEIMRAIFIQNPQNPRTYFGISQMKNFLKNRLADPKSADDTTKMTYELDVLRDMNSESLLTFVDDKIEGAIGCNRFVASAARDSRRDGESAITFEISNTNISRKLCEIPQLVDFEVDFAKYFNGQFFIRRAQNSSEIVMYNENMQLFLLRKK